MNNEPNRDREPTSEGLFPDESYTEVKRENPYLRKNRKKVEPQSQKTGSPLAESTDDTPLDDAGEHRRSNFFFEHVKLITAILTSLVILSLVFVTDIVDIVQNFATRQEQADQSPLTMDYVEALTHKSEPIIWEDLSRFRRYDSSEAKNSVTWFFKVSGTPYEVWISGVSTKQTPTYVHLYDMTSGRVLDLNKGNLSDFLETETGDTSDIES